VSATLKGNAVSTLQVAVPGGNYQGMHQSVAGTPGLQTGSEYVFFVWTAPSGSNYIIGLSQGLFEVHTNASGAVVLTADQPARKTIDAAGSGVNDNGVTLLLTDLQARSHRVEGRKELRSGTGVRMSRRGLLIGAIAVVDGERRLRQLSLRSLCGQFRTLHPIFEPVPGREPAAGVVPYFIQEPPATLQFSAGDTFPSLVSQTVQQRRCGIQWVPPPSASPSRMATRISS